KNVLNFMRHVTHSIAVQVIAAIIAPVVSAAAFLPARVAAPADESQRAEIFDEVVFDKQVLRGTAEDFERQVVFGDHVAAKDALGQSLGKDAIRIVNDEVLFSNILFEILEENAE